MYDPASLGMMDGAANVGTKPGHVKKRRRWRPAWLVVLLVVGVPAAVDAQIFLGSRPRPEFQVGPLFVRANVTPRLGDVEVDVFFSLVLPAGRSPGQVEQDLYFVWPAAVNGDAKLGPPDPALARYIDGLGFSVLEEGRLPLVARRLQGARGAAALEAIAGGAPYVTYVRTGGALGLSSPATYVRIPWTPKLVDRTYLLDLKLVTRDLVKPKPATWFERTFWGPRHRVVLGFNDVRGRAVFPVYFANRDRVARLSEDPSQLIVNFAQADRLKIDELFPQSSNRRLSESLENTDTVSLFLDRSEGITPQVLTIQFGYFSGLQSWGPVLIPILFFTLGNLAGPILRAAFAHASRRMKARVQFGRADAPRGSGTVLERDTLARIVPGETRYEDVVRLCGGPGEEHERLEAPGQRTLVYRGRRGVPHRDRSFGWVATIAHWDVEHHEVEIAFDHDVVRDVQARIRRTRLPSPDVR